MYTLRFGTPLDTATIRLNRCSERIRYTELAFCPCCHEALRKPSNVIRSSARSSAVSEGWGYCFYCLSSNTVLLAVQRGSRQFLCLVKIYGNSAAAV